MAVPRTGMGRSRGHCECADRRERAGPGSGGQAIDVHDGRDLQGARGVAQHSRTLQSTRCVHSLAFAFTVVQGMRVRQCL